MFDPEAVQADEHFFHNKTNHFCLSITFSVSAEECKRARNNLRSWVEGVWRQAGPTCFWWSGRHHRLERVKLSVKRVPAVTVTRFA